MKTTPDDPRLTAYALDELDGAEREAIETELEDSDECQREVEEIARTAALLSAELAAEPLPQLTYAQQLAIEAKLKPHSGKTESERHFPIGVLLKGRNPLRRALGFAVGAAVLVGIWLGLSSLFTAGPGTTALAQTLEQFQKARLITWTKTIYIRESSEDRQQTWLKTLPPIRCAYTAPGLYREERVDASGQTHIYPNYTKIADTINRRELVLNPAQRKAILRDVDKLEFQIGEPEGPNASVMKLLEGDDLQFVETRKTPTGEVNVLRYGKKYNSGKYWSYDYWIDAKTKQLVELHIPGTDIFDPDKDPARDNPPGKMFWGDLPGVVMSGFVFSAELDESLFRLDPPADYTVETITRSPRYNLTEKEMIDFLGILADYNDQTFPARQELAGVFSDGRHTKTMEKPKEDRSPAEQKFWETLGHYIEANQNDRPIGLNDPVGYFLNHSTVENSFRYLGKGVKLGDKDRLVCWYKLKGATTYRVVYADLSIRDIPPEDLPLPVEP